MEVGLGSLVETEFPEPCEFPLLPEPCEFCSLPEFKASFQTGRGNTYISRILLKN